METEPKPTTEENFEATVVPLSHEEQEQEHLDSAELMATLTHRYDELESKIMSGNLSKEQVLEVQEEMNKIEEKRAELESVTEDKEAA